MALAVAAIQADVQRLGADAPAPVVEQSIVATLRAGELTLTGTDFGEASAGSAVLFDYGPRRTTVTSDPPLNWLAAKWKYSSFPSDRLKTAGTPRPVGTNSRWQSTAR